MKSRLLLAALVCLACAVAVALVGTAGADPGDAEEAPSFEVWLIDQQDSAANGAEGRLHIFHGERLVDDPAGATPETIELGGAVRAYCTAQNGHEPRRPHMLVFNGGDNDGAGGNTHAVIAYVATGHIAFLDATHARAGRLHRRGHPGPRRLADPRPGAPDRGQPERQAAAADRDRLRERLLRAREHGDAQPRYVHHAERRRRARTRHFAPTTPRSARAPRATAPSRS